MSERTRSVPTNDWEDLREDLNRITCEVCDDYRYSPTEEPVPGIKVHYNLRRSRVRYCFSLADAIIALLKQRCP